MLLGIELNENFLEDSGIHIRTKAVDGRAWCRHSFAKLH
jgi:hypothetical protein